MMRCLGMPLEMKKPIFRRQFLRRIRDARHTPTVKRRTTAPDAAISALRFAQHGPKMQL
jgi:hypothetical protein